MPRIRTIKPEFWKHPVICRLPDDFQLLALSLLSMADDEGFFRADPFIVRGEVMPFRESLARIREGLDKLSEVGWIELSEHSEQGLIGHIINWAKHQKVDHPSPSKLKVYFSREHLATDSRTSRDALAPDQGSRIKDQGRDQGALDESREEANPEESKTDHSSLVSKIGHLYPGNAHLTPTSPLRRIDEEAILQALIRDSDKVLVGTKAYAAAVKSWPPRERKYIPSADKFYSASEYLKDPAEWEREPSPSSGPVFKSKGDGLTALERTLKQKEEAMREAGLIS